MAADQGHGGTRLSQSQDVPLYRCLTALPLRRRVVTIGSFDGVHLGHQKLLREANARGQALGLESMVLTFEPIPSLVLRPDRFPGRICSFEEKAHRISKCGVDAITVLEFSRDFSEQTAEEFMTEMARRVHPVQMLVGEAFALGRNREGTVSRLTDIAEDLGFDVVPVPRLQDGDTVISSSRIRSAVMTGDVALAHRYLGRPFRVTGPVIHGAHLGRAIGFPTANVEPSADLVVPADGIYVSLAAIGEERQTRPAMTYVGTRPTVNTGGRLVETHLLDFDADIYGRELKVDLLCRLREDRRFESLEMMIDQLRDDEHATRDALRSISMI